LTDLLNQVYKTKVAHISNKKFSFGSEITLMKYEFELAEKVLFYEYNWHCSLVFSVFDEHTLMKLLTSLMLEHSLVFVHDKLAIITSVILGFKLLLRPF
jgi:hypothetical protein